MDDTRPPEPASTPLGDEAARSEFLAAVSHELRTPLNVIVGLTELALETTDPDERRDYLVRVLGNAGALIGLVDDLLDLTRIDARQLAVEVEDFDPAALVEAVAESMAVRLDERPVEFVCVVAADVPRVVRGDPRRVRQVLLNLVGNAIKFTDEGSITLALEPGEGGLCIRVSDTGPGIPEAERARLFRRFHRARDGIWRERGGSGLGLSITRSLVELMGGTIAVSGAVGQGSTFTVELPLPVVTPAEPALPERVEGRVLLVEDHPGVRAMLCRTLEDLGFLVDEAADGRGALRAVRRASGPYVLALVDGDLEDAPGPALLDLLGGRPSLRGVPVVTMGRAGGGERAARTVARPITRRRLLTVLERCLGRRFSAEVVSSDATEPPRADAPRVLIVDDNDDNRLLAERTLAGRGYRVEGAEDGLDAVQKADGGGYDLIVMDIQMPNLDGFAASRRIRLAEQRAGRRRVPIVALTAHAGAGFRQQCLDAGMDDYVAKPLDRRALVAVIDAALGFDLRPISDPPAAAEAPAVDEVPRIDPSIIDLLPGFVRNRRADVAALRAWLAGAEDPMVARRVAHGLKGCGGAFGFPLVSTLGAALQADAERRDVAAARPRVARLAAYLDAVARAVEAEAAAQGVPCDLGEPSDG